jgi:hypothetical protein
MNQDLIGPRADWLNGPLRPKTSRCDQHVRPLVSVTL